MYLRPEFEVKNSLSPSRREVLLFEQFSQSLTWPFNSAACELVVLPAKEDNNALIPVIKTVFRLLLLVIVEFSVFIIFGVVLLVVKVLLLVKEYEEEEEETLVVVVLVLLFEVVPKEGGETDALRERQQQ